MVFLSNSFLQKNDNNEFQEHCSVLTIRQIYILFHAIAGTYVTVVVPDVQAGKYLPSLCTIMELQQYLLLPVSSKLSSKCFNAPLSTQDKYQSSFLMSLSSHHTSSTTSSVPLSFCSFLSFFLSFSPFIPVFFIEFCEEKRSLIRANSLTVKSVIFQYSLNDCVTQNFQCKSQIKSRTSNLPNMNHRSASIIRPTLHTILVTFSLVVASFVPIQRMYIIGRRNEKPVNILKYEIPISFFWKKLDMHDIKILKSTF